MYSILINDKTFGLEEVPIKQLRTREGARGIVRRSDGKIAIFNKQVKNEYKLPGGGIDPNEDPIIAFKREVMEETGCIIDNIKEVGVVKEFQSLESFQQISHVFISEVVSDTKQLSLTEKEKEENAILCWLEPKEALNKLESCIPNLVDDKYDNVYRSKFMVKRDIEILKQYLFNQEA